VCPGFIGNAGSKFYQDQTSFYFLAIGKCLALYYNGVANSTSKPQFPLYSLTLPRKQKKHPCTDKTNDKRLGWAQEQGATMHYCEFEQNR
jgi:hypothetical protein